MRVIVLVKATEDSERGNYADHADEFAAMGRYNEELVKAGIMLAADGLAPSAEGKRVVYDSAGGSRVIDGPFAEAKEIVGGFWIWQVSSLEEAVEWVKRAPFASTSVELRRIHEAADFAGQLPQDIIDAEKQLRAHAGQQRDQ
ncbi:YciI family protein [Trebonia sp.]|uniref:YciI family protein n=1 Tax=Trebonia sp. TaxID=2767075 RepID=UPI00261B7C8A|nr:YciI family protein [Trebonia sp.]